MNNWKAFVTVIALIGAALPACGGKTVTEAGASFASRVAGKDGDLVLRGTGLLRYAYFIKVYAAALYCEEGVGEDRVLQDGARRLEVAYLVGAKAEDFIKAGNQVLARSYAKDVLATIRERLDRLNGWYPDPAPGDRCAITYHPGYGTELSFNGKPLGVVKGADFARIYFSIWLGEKPADAKLKRDLLGRVGG